MNLDGIRAKMRRAKQDIEVIEEREGNLREEVLRHIVREVHRDVDEQRWVYRGSTPKVPVDLAVIIGEVFYNMRSALDHLVWQSVLDEGEEPSKRNFFPITYIEKSWLKSMRTHLKGVNENLIEAIGDLQPYTGGPWFPFKARMLGAVNKLNNIDKHRHLIVPVMAVEGMEPMFFGENQPPLPESPDRPSMRGELRLAEVRENHTILVFNNPDIELCPSFHIHLKLAGVEQEWTIAESVPEFLRDCLKAVEGSVDFLAKHTT